MWLGQLTSSFIFYDNWKEPPVQVRNNVGPQSPKYSMLNGPLAYSLSHTKMYDQQKNCQKGGPTKHICLRVPYDSQWPWVGDSAGPQSLGA